MSEGDIARLEEASGLEFKPKARQAIRLIAEGWVSHDRDLQSPRPRDFRKRLQQMEQVATTVMDIEIDRENATNFDLHLSTWLLNVDFEAARDTLRLSALMADQAHQLIEALRLVQQRLHPTAAEAVQWTSTLHHIPRRPVRNVGLTSDRVCRGGFRLRQYAFPPTRLQAVRDLAIKEATYRERPRRGNNFGPQRAPPPLPKRVIWASCARAADHSLSDPSYCGKSRPSPSTMERRCNQQRRYLPIPFSLRRKLPSSWLAKSRLTGTGPPFVKVGRAVRYRLSAVQDYIKARNRASTTEA